jgi:hypothetical protein
MRNRSRAGYMARRPGRLAVTLCYSQRAVPRGHVTLTYDEAMAMCLLLAEAADAASNEDAPRYTWTDEARLMIEMILSRTDE